MSSLDSDFVPRAIQVFGSTIAKAWRARIALQSQRHLCDFYTFGEEIVRDGRQWPLHQIADSIDTGLN